MALPAFNHETGRHLAVGGARIYYELHDRDTDPPLVLLHGGMGSMEDFNALLPRLQGRSTLGSDGLSYDLIQQDVEAVLDHLGLQLDGPRGYPGDSVQRITSELLVVHGDDDHLVSRQNTWALAEQVKGARRLNIPFAGYVAHDEQPELAMLGINRFLQHRAEAPPPA